jgi:hypothetical protein
MSLGFSDEEGRALYEASFEPHGNGYVFYRNAWSRGIAVTAEEREASLQPPFWRSRMTLQRKIRGRPSAAPRRSWLTAQRRMILALPASFGLAMLAGAVAAILHAQNYESAALRWMQTGLGLALALYGAMLLTIRSRG